MSRLSADGVATTTLEIASADPARRKLPRAILSCHPDDPFVLHIDAPLPTGPVFYTFEHRLLRSVVLFDHVCSDHAGLEIHRRETTRGERIVFRLPPDGYHAVILIGTRVNLRLFIERTYKVAQYTSLDRLINPS